MTDNDLVERLRDQQDMIQLGEDAYEAADAIERLKELADKFMWQVRDTCARAEAAEARIAKLEAALRSVEVEAVDLERRCSKLGHDRFSDQAEAIAVIARAALEGKP
jgi:chromosome segregation ATPase